MRRDNCVEVGDPECAENATSVCLTPSQAARLGVGEQIGCGCYACAYASGRRRVVKLTRDPTDVAALQLGQGDPHVVKLYEAHRLKGTNVYAAVTARLDELPDFVQRVFEKGGAYAGALLGEHYASSPDAGTSRYEVPATVRQRAADHTCAADQHECRRVVGEIADTHERLGRLGINWNDTHDGNVRWNARDGTWQAIDLGVSESGRPQVADLAGLRLGARGWAGAGLLGAGLLWWLAGRRGAAAMRSPFAFLAPVTSGWGDPRPYRDGAHEGVDFDVPSGTPVLAVASGSVYKVHRDPCNFAGLHIGLAHDDGAHRSLYFHLSRVDVAQGVRVAAGTRLGLAGRTGGNMQGPGCTFGDARDHLHMTIRLRRDRIPRGLPIGLEVDGYTAVPAEPLLPAAYSERVATTAASLGFSVRRA